MCGDCMVWRGSGVALRAYNVYAHTIITSHYNTPTKRSLSFFSLLALLRASSSCTNGESDVSTPPATPPVDVLSAASATAGVEIANTAAASHATVAVCREDDGAWRMQDGAWVLWFVRRAVIVGRTTRVGGWRSIIMGRIDTVDEQGGRPNLGCAHNLLCRVCIIYTQTSFYKL